MSDPAVTEGTLASIPTPPPPTRSDAEIARTLYDPRLMYESSFRDAINRLRDEGDYTEAAAAEHLDGMSEAMSDAGLSTQDAERLHSIIVDRMLRPVDEETARKEHSEAKKYLREKGYSDREAERRLGVMKTFLKAHPTLNGALTASRAGSHPHIVRLLDDRLGHLNTTRHPREVKRAAAKGAGR